VAKAFDEVPWGYFLGVQETPTVVGAGSEGLPATLVGDGTTETRGESSSEEVALAQLKIGLIL